MLLLYRRYIAKHPFLRRLPRRLRKRAFLLRAFAGRCYRLLRHPSRIAPMLRDKALAVRRRIWPAFSAKAVALAKARAIGGAVPLAELERLWEAAGRARRALCVAEGPDLAQLKIILDACGVAVVPPGGSNAGSAGEADLTIVVEAEQAAGRDDPPSPGTLRLVREPDEPHVAGGDATAGNAASRALKILLLNDSGFQYGAGIALKRQAASFLLNGWDVVVMAWRAGSDRQCPAIVGSGQLGGWHGVRTLGDPDRSRNYDSERLIGAIKARLPFRPDVIVLGNTHGAGWPVDLPARLGELGAPVLAYMHDCYWITGRCAHPGPCTLFRAGCDASCPTPREYPALAPEKIAPAWRERSEVFAGPGKASLVANSDWTLDIVRQRYGSAARSETVHLGLDHRLFSPLCKSTVRRILGLPADKLLIAMGAVDIDNQWKGGPIFERVYRALRSRDDVGLLLFGRASERLPSVRSFGLIDDERLMPFLYNAADIYLTTATAESFGQTLLEASACALPVVAFRVGGIPDIVAHGESGLLVDPLSVPDLLAAVESLLGDRELRRQMGRNGRARVERNFTLALQAQRWKSCLARLRQDAASHGAPFSAISGSVA